jgi:hydrogenase maturation protease
VILLAGVGYPDLSDLSFGPRLTERLRDMPWPPGVQIENLSYGPIAVIHWFEDHPGRFERAIFFGAAERGREPGTLAAYGWLADSLSPEDVQASVSEAVTGIISLENLLIIAHHFGVLPPETSVVELEPVELEWGMKLSALGEERMEQAATWIRHEVYSGAQPAGNGRRKEETRYG